MKPHSPPQSPQRSTDPSIWLRTEASRSLVGGFFNLSHKSLWFIFFLISFFPVLIHAEHTAEHRFHISGYVYDDTGNPLPGKVVVRDQSDRILGMTDAGRSGYYHIQLHLHNSNLGDRLVIHSAAGKKELVVKFDSDDLTTARTAEVHFGKVPPSAGFLSNGAFLFGIAATAVAGTFYFVRKYRRRRKHDRGKKKGKKSNKGK
jgi:hypothetical protein